MKRGKYFEVSLFFFGKSRCLEKALMDNGFFFLIIFFRFCHETKQAIIISHTRKRQRERASGRRQPAWGPLLVARAVQLYTSVGRSVVLRSFATMIPICWGFGCACLSYYTIHAYIYTHPRTSVTPPMTLSGQRDSQAGSSVSRVRARVDSFARLRRIE